jgi:heptosyltransferase-1
MKQILVIRVGRAGDMVMITPALLAIIDNYPEHEVHILTSQDGKRVLSGFDSSITKIYIFQKKRVQTILARRKQLNDIQKTGYEYIFNFELKPSYKRLYKSLNAKVFELDESEPKLNYAKRCLNVVQKSIENEISNYWDWLPVTDDGVEKARIQLSGNGIYDTDFVVGIHPSFSGSKKGLFSNKNRNYMREWPVEYFAELINMLAKYSDENNLNIKIVIDLLPDEKVIGERIVEDVGDNLVLYTMKPDFQRYKALIKRMNLLITPDTGPMHIAAALGTKIVCLFSGKSPEDCGPYIDPTDYIALVAENYDAEVGLQAIKPEHVFDACKRFLPG